MKKRKTSEDWAREKWAKGKFPKKVIDFNKLLEELEVLSHKDLIYLDIRRLLLKAKMKVLRDLKSKKFNAGKDILYRGRKKYTITPELIINNPKKAKRMIESWFRDNYRYEIYGLDTGGVLDKDIIKAYLERLKNIEYKKMREKEIRKVKEKKGKEGFLVYFYNKKNRN